MRLLKPILIVALFAMSAPLDAADAPPTAPAPAAVAPAASATDALRKASTPSDAVAAYAQAAGVVDPVELEKVYVRKMIDFGMPELAEAQAHDLLNRNASDPPSIGVVAFMYAARGDYGAAAQNLKVALMQSPDDVFLLRTGGQFLAWYDAQTDRSKLTATDTSALEWIRASATSKPAFADAYRAFAAAPNGQNNPATQPTGDAGQVIIPPQANVDYSAAPMSTYSPYYSDSTYLAYPIYTNPFYSYSYYDSPWRSHYYYDSFGRGFGRSYYGGSIFIRPDHDRDHDRDRHDGDRDRFDRSDRFRDGRDNVIVPLRPNTRDGGRGRDDGRDGRDVRPPPTFRGATPSEAKPAPARPPMQKFTPASPAPRDPAKSSSNAKTSSGGSRSSGDSKSSGDNSRSRGASRSPSGGSSSGGDRGSRYHR